MGRGLRAVASLLGVEGGKAETRPEASQVEPGGALTLDENKPFKPASEMLAALTEPYSNGQKVAPTLDEYRNVGGPIPLSIVSITQEYPNRSINDIPKKLVG